MIAAVGILGRYEIAPLARLSGDFNILSIGDLKDRYDLLNFAHLTSQNI